MLRPTLHPCFIEISSVFCLFEILLMDQHTTDEKILFSAVVIKSKSCSNFPKECQCYKRCQQQKRLKQLDYRENYDKYNTE